MSSPSPVMRFADIGRKILAVGRNFKDHALELGNAVPEQPIIFMKPTTSYVTEGNPIKIPPGCTELHHEVELGVVIGKKGKNIPENEAMNYVAGYALALDMTARNLQNEAKKKGLPWTIAKGFDTSCPVSQFVALEKIPDPHLINLWLKVNNEIRQDGSTSDMIFKIPNLLSYISSYFTLEPGDLVLTGTPSGVGPVKHGDIIEAGIEEVIAIKFEVINPNCIKK